MAGAWERRLEIILTSVTNSCLVMERKHIYRWLSVIKPDKIQAEGPHHRIPLYNWTVQLQNYHILEITSAGGKKNNTKTLRIFYFLSWQDPVFLLQEQAIHNSKTREAADKQGKKKEGRLPNFSTKQLFIALNREISPNNSEFHTCTISVGKMQLVTSLAAFLLVISSSIA